MLFMRLLAQVRAIKRQGRRMGALVSNAGEDSKTAFGIWLQE